MNGSTKGRRVAGREQSADIPDDIRSAAQSGDVRGLMSRLTPQQTEQLKRILNDEDAAKRLLATPQAQALIKGLKK